MGPQRSATCPPWPRPHIDIGRWNWQDPRIDLHRCIGGLSGEPIPFYGGHRMTGGLGRRLLGEFLGTAFLVAAVIGSGIMASRLSPNDAGLELLENATATAAALVAIILAIGPVSGAHLNPVVTLADRFF